MTRQANARLSTSLLYLKQQTDFSLNKDIFRHSMPRRYWIVTFKESNISQFVLTETNCDHFTLNFLITASVKVFFQNKSCVTSALLREFNEREIFA